MNLSRENPRLFSKRGLLSVFGYALGCALWYTSLSFWLTAGVDLGGGDIRVAQHFLDGAQIRTVLQQVGGKGVAQRMGSNVLLDPRLLLVVLDELPEA